MYNYIFLWRAVVVERFVAQAIITNTIYHSSSSSVNISTYSSSSFIQLIFYLPSSPQILSIYQVKYLTQDILLGIPINTNINTRQPAGYISDSEVWGLVLNDSHEYFSQIQDSQLSNENYRRIMFYMTNKIFSYVHFTIYSM